MLFKNRHSVLFKYRAYADTNKKKEMHPSFAEFLWRFKVHILPQGFVKIRNYGLLQNHGKITRLNSIREQQNLSLPQQLHSFIHSIIHSFHSGATKFITTSAASFIPSFYHSLILSFIHSFIHSIILSFIHSFIHSFILSDLSVGRSFSRWTQRNGLISFVFRLRI